MKKIKLSLDDLEVNSFDVLPESADSPGTVQGREAAESEASMCESRCNTCNLVATCAVSLCATYCESCQNYTWCDSCDTLCPSCDTGCTSCLTYPTCPYPC